MLGAPSLTYTWCVTQEVGMRLTLAGCHHEDTTCCCVLVVAVRNEYVTITSTMTRDKRAPDHVCKAIGILLVSSQPSAIGGRLCSSWCQCMPVQRSSRE